MQIHTENIGTIEPDQYLDAPATVTRGTTTTITVRFDPGGSTSSSGAGFTYGTTDGALWNSTDGGIYATQSTTTRTDIEKMHELSPIAGAYAAGTDVDGTPWFREQSPLSDRSVIVGIETEYADLLGAWALLDGFREDGPRSSSVHIAELRVYVLGEYTEYADHAGVRNALEA